MQQVVIIGGGAAGIFAAIGAKKAGAQVKILEKNKRLGIKLLITGKGRCNLTNAGEVEDLIQNFPGNGNFLYSAFYTFSNQDLIRFLHKIGVQTKVERGGRVFPESEQAQKVVNALHDHLRQLQVEVLFSKKVDRIHVMQNQVEGVFSGGDYLPARAVIVCTGGLSYPKTGSSGDGYKWAESLGHTVKPLLPSLVPLEIKEKWVTELAGLGLKNVKAVAYNHRHEKIDEEFGEMLFTHFGVSGPIILTLSRKIVLEMFRSKKETYLEINLKPALSSEALDNRLQRDLSKYANKQLKNGLTDLLPRSMIMPVIKVSALEENKFCHQLTKEERRRLADVLQHLPLTVTGARPIEEAIITAGGINVKELNPATMESRLIKGLYFAGEIIDVDAYTGGYNLQAAFSTGYTAGTSAAVQLNHHAGADKK